LEAIPLLAEKMCLHNTQKALLDWLAHEEIRRQMTLEALADVDAGRVASHETVRAWAESLQSPKTKKR